MFNILVDELPHHVEVDDVQYPVNALAPTLIRIALLLEDNAFKSEEAYAQMGMQQLSLFYPKIPLNIHEAMVRLIDFYTYSPLFSAKRVGSRRDNDFDTDSSKMAYSYKYDASLIYAGFAQQYPQHDIKKLHWWEFKAMLEGLTEECLFVKVTQYRTMKITNKMSKEEKAFYRRMKEQWALPDNRPQEQKDMDFAQALFYM